MTLKNQSLLIKVLTATTLIPAVYLLGVSLILLIPNLFDNIKHNSIFETTIVFISIVFGILGFVALILQLITKPLLKLKLKILFQLLSIIGYFSFVSVLTGIQGWKNLFDSLINIKDNLVDFYMVLWPIIVTGILLFFNYNLYKKTE